MIWKKESKNKMLKLYGLNEMREMYLIKIYKYFLNKKRKIKIL